MNTKHVVAIGIAVIVALVVFRPKETRQAGSPGTTELASTDLVQVISKHGESVRVEDHVRSSGWTVVEFGADW